MAIKLPVKADPDGRVSQEYYDRLVKLGASQRLLSKLKVREKK